MSVHVQPSQYSVCRTGLEVFKTDEDGFKPYISGGVIQNSSSDSSSEEDSESVGYKLHQGDVLETYHYANLESCSYENDYADMSSNSTFKVPDVDKYKFYKGVRVCLRKEWESPNKKLTWNDLPQVFTGFINEQTFSEDGVEVKLNGVSALLDKKFSFEFTNMKRSKILEEIIKTAGLTPVINVNGLDDDVTNFSTKSSSGSSNSSSNVSESTGSDELDKVVEKAIANKTNDLDKAKAVDKAFKKHVFYKYYWNVRQSSVEKAWKYAHLNCADGANVLCAMFLAAGLNAVIVHTTGHYIVKVKIKGKSYYTDNAAATGSHTSRAFGKVWRGITSGSEVGTKIAA